MLMFFLRAVDYSKVAEMKPMVFWLELINKITNAKENQNAKFYFSFSFQNWKIEATKERFIFVFSKDYAMHLRLNPSLNAYKENTCYFYFFFINEK